ncbi:response regulator transcription factor [Sphingomonas sp. R-74633]|uniref:response regulator transcription factor n=1 Tax=Sphingomonas sp. R-74633 TaxID=2751188 RepID=UPI0015D2FDF4|nr:response regulator [Sphingomonas sp. R-74633]NYT41432.1 response regulator transcription factor [Sphingomonas sp. R-74633]
MADTRPLVAIVDDDVSIREALEPLLELSGWRVRSFEYATAFLDWTAPEGPGCLLLDVSLPDLNGLDLQARIADERPEMPIIFLTGYGDVPMTVRAMKAGAVEFLTKPFDDEVLLAAVERAIERSEQLTAQRSGHRALQARYALLSRREREVMHLIVAGLLNKQVGGELGISEITVKAHRGRLMDKMEAASFADLVKMSEKLGLETTGRR